MYISPILSILLSDKYLISFGSMVSADNFLWCKTNFPEFLSLPASLGLHFAHCRSSRSSCRGWWVPMIRPWWMVYGVSVLCWFAKVTLDSARRYPCSVDASLHFASFRAISAMKLALSTFLLHLVGSALRPLRHYPTDSIWSCFLMIMLTAIGERSLTFRPPSLIAFHAWKMDHDHWWTKAFIIKVTWALFWLLVRSH